jgi:hypothetical protein
LIERFGHFWSDPRILWEEVEMLAWRPALEMIASVEQDLMEEARC